MAVVSVTAADTGEPVTTAEVSVNGTQLNYSADLKAYSIWLTLLSEQPVSLTVKNKSNTYIATGKQAPVFPLMVSPRKEYLVSSPPQFRVDLVRTEPTLVTWEGWLPSADYRFAVIALDERGQLAWPQTAAFQVLAPEAARSWTIPANSIPKGFASIAAGITRSYVVSGAASGSNMVVGNFDSSPVDTNEYDGLGPFVLGSIELSRPAVAVAPQREIQLWATGTYTDYRPTRRDLTGRVQWTSSAPDVAVVGPGGLITGVSPGQATVTAQFGDIRATSIVTVRAPRPTSPSDDVVAYQGDAGHSGQVSTSGTLALPGNPAWTKHLDGTISSPLIVGEKLFFVEQLDGIGQTPGFTLRALNIKTGEPLWLPVQLDATGTPWGIAYDQGRLFVMQGTRLGKIQSFDAESGVSVWSQNLGDLYADVWSFGSAPTALNGVVYVMASGVASTLFAFDGNTGTLLWMAPHLAGGGNGTVAVGNDSVYVSGNLQDYRIDALTGAILWRNSGAGSGGGGYTPALSAGKLYVRDPIQGRERVLDALTGEIAGVYSSDPPPTNPVANGMTISAFGTTSRFDVDTGQFDRYAGQMSAVDLATGAVSWRFAGDGKLGSAPFLAGKVVFVLSTAGMAFGVDAASGQEVWRTRVGTSSTPPDEWNPRPLRGIAATSRWLVIPADHDLAVFELTNH